MNNKILKLLENNARMSNETISAITGLTDAETSEAIENMENKGCNLKVAGHPILDFFYLNKNKNFEKCDKKCPAFSKNSVAEELTSLNGKVVTLIGKYNNSKDTFYVCGMLEK